MKSTKYSREIPYNMKRWIQCYNKGYNEVKPTFLTLNVGLQLKMLTIILDNL